MKTLILTILLLFMFTGCEENHINERASMQPSGVVEIGPNIYIKAIIIDPGGIGYHVVYVYCDKNGKIITNTSITTNYQAGKQDLNFTVLN